MARMNSVSESAKPNSRRLGCRDAEGVGIARLEIVKEHVPNTLVILHAPPPGVARNTKNTSIVGFRNSTNASSPSDDARLPFLVATASGHGGSVKQYTPSVSPAACADEATEPGFASSPWRGPPATSRR